MLDGMYAAEREEGLGRAPGPNLTTALPARDYVLSGRSG